MGVAVAQRLRTRRSKGTSPSRCAPTRRGFRLRGAWRVCLCVISLRHCWKRFSFAAIAPGGAARCRPRASSRGHRLSRATRSPCPPPTSPSGTPATHRDRYEVPRTPSGCPLHTRNTAPPVRCSCGPHRRGHRQRRR